LPENFQVGVKLIRFFVYVTLPGSPESGDIAHYTFKKEGNGGGGAFSNNVIGNSMIYQDRSK